MLELTAADGARESELQPLAASPPSPPQLLDGCAGALAAAHRISSDVARTARKALELKVLSHGGRVASTLGRRTTHIVPFTDRWDLSGPLTGSSSSQRAAAAPSTAAPPMLTPSVVLRALAWGLERSEAGLSAAAGSRMTMKRLWQRICCGGDHIGSPPDPGNSGSTSAKRVHFVDANWILDSVGRMMPPSSRRRRQESDYPPRCLYGETANAPSSQGRGTQDNGHISEVESEKLRPPQHHAPNSRLILWDWGPYLGDDEGASDRSSASDDAVDALAEAADISGRQAPKTIPANARGSKAGAGGRAGKRTRRSSSDSSAADTPPEEEQPNGVGKKARRPAKGIGGGRRGRAPALRLQRAPPPAKRRRRARASGLEEQEGSERDMASASEIEDDEPPSDVEDEVFTAPSDRLPSLPEASEAFSHGGDSQQMRAADHQVDTQPMTTQQQQATLRSRAAQSVLDMLEDFAEEAVPIGIGGDSGVGAPLCQHELSTFTGNASGALPCGPSQALPAATFSSTTAAVRVPLAGGQGVSGTAPSGSIGLSVQDQIEAIDSRPKRKLGNWKAMLSGVLPMDGNSQQHL